MQQRPRHPVLANIGLVLASVVFFLVASEFFLRAFMGGGSLWHYPNYIVEGNAPDPEHEAQMRYDPLLGYEPIPGYKGTLEGRPISFDANGLREHDLDAPTPLGAPILAVGDSLTEGYLVGNDETWPANLQRLTGRPVLNGGVRAYGLDQAILRAERLVPKLKPQTLVLAFIPDDIERSELFMRDDRPKAYFVLSDKGEDGLELKNVPVPKTIPPMATWRSILGYSFFLDYFARRMVLYKLWYGNTQHAHHDGVEVSCRLMIRFARLVRQQAVQALVVAIYEDDDWLVPRLAKVHRVRTSYVLGCAAKQGLPTLDTWDGFAKAGMPQKDDVLYGGLHFTDAGAKVAARLIAEKLGR